MRIRELPIELRPREKALHYGVESLSDEELLTLIIGSGVKGHSALDISRSLLNSYLTLNALANASVSSLEEYKGLSKNTSLRLLATFEFHNRLNSPFYQYDYQIENAQDIYSRYRYLEDYSQEVLAILMLSKKRKIIKERILYKGTDNHLSINPRDIYAEIIASKCSYFVLIHNHPSGEKEPSEEDILVTDVIKSTSETIHIKMLDHIIIFPGGYYSFNECGALKKS